MARSDVALFCRHTRRWLLVGAWNVAAATVAADAAQNGPTILYLGKLIDTVPAVPGSRRRQLLQRRSRADPAWSREIRNWP